MSAGPCLCRRGMPRISGGSHQASWLSQALMTFPAQQRALGRIVSYKTDLWIGFSFPSQPSTKEQQVLPPNKMTKSVTQMGRLSTASGAVCRAHAIPNVCERREGGVTVLKLPPASSRTPKFPMGRRPCLRADFYTALREKHISAQRGEPGRPAPHEHLSGSVTN